MPEGRTGDLKWLVLDIYDFMFHDRILAELKK
jgi:hypothetical protein